jgi:hypothetical protein
MSFDGRALWNCDSRTGVNRLNQPCRDGLARLCDAQALLEHAPKIVTRSDHDRTCGGRVSCAAASDADVAKTENDITTLLMYDFIIHLGDIG